MKRLNSFLLTSYPLLWNLRVHLVWPMIVAMHLLFFAWGYSNAELANAIRYSRFTPGAEVVTIAVLLGLAVLIIWLALYFRNNAFKSFYPLRRGRLAMEALLVFVTSFGLASIAESYRSGGELRIRQRSWGIDVEAEQETVALAKHFLPFYLSNFSRFRSCDGYESMVLPKDSAGVSVDTFSYLNYCETTVIRGEDGSSRYLTSDNTARARRWLRAGNRDSVEWILNKYFKIVKEHGGHFVLDPAAHTKAIFVSPGFQLQYTIRSVYRYEGYNASEALDNLENQVVSGAEVSGRQAPELKYGEKFAYVEDRKVDEALSMLAYARRGSYPMDTVIFLLYAALTFTILIMAFRLTDLRTFGFAILGAILWCIVIGLIVAVIHGDSGAVTFLLMLEGGFTAAFLLMLYSKGSRRTTGLFYLWSLAGMPFVMPLIWWWINEFADDRFESRFETLNWWMLGNVGFSLLMLLVLYIPMARKWQAMPAE